MLFIDFGGDQNSHIKSGVVTVVQKLKLPTNLWRIHLYANSCSDQIRQHNPDLASPDHQTFLFRTQVRETNSQSKKQARHLITRAQKLLCHPFVCPTKEPYESYPKQDFIPFLDPPEEESLISLSRP